MTKKIKTEEKKNDNFVVCPCCGCVTIIDRGYYEQRCDVCHNYFELGFQTFSKD